MVSAGTPQRPALPRGRRSSGRRTSGAGHRAPAATIRSLKEQIDGDIYVSGSGTLVRAILADGLLDESHLFVFPLTLGAGARLFAAGAATTKLTLAGADAYDSGACTWPTGRLPSGRAER